MTSIAITGASSGIGAALARAYAGPGARLALHGRDRDRLDAVAESCTSRGAAVETGVFDIRDRSAVEDWMNAVDERAPLDLAIANAGILHGTPGGNDHEGFEIGLTVIETNLIGSISAASLALDAMTGRGRGQVAFVSSLAGYVPHPDWPAYCASKAALIAYGIAVRERVRASGVRVNVICPGWVKTPMNAAFSMWRPFEMTPEKAAARIVHGLSRDEPVISFPRQIAIASRLGRLLPATARRLGNAAFRAKPAGTEAARNNHPDNLASSRKENDRT